MDQSEHQPDANAQSSGLLVKKWSSVIRMQKKAGLDPYLPRPPDHTDRFFQIMDLDQRLQQALEDNARGPSTSSSKKFDEDWTPKPHSAKHVLSGHRDRVNAISFHPRYSVIASAGEDAMLKVWDWETGELERTLKGHTMAIKDCEFDSKGMKLGACSHGLQPYLTIKANLMNHASLGRSRHICQTLERRRRIRELCNTTRARESRVVMSVYAQRYPRCKRWRGSHGTIMGGIDNVGPSRQFSSSTVPLTIALR